MKQKIIFSLLVLSIIGGAVFWWLTQPQITAAADLPKSENIDLANGERIFWAGGCASCHAKEKADGDERLLLGGGHQLPSPFGTFITPNISPDNDTGIGKWTFAEFFNAMKHGVSPTGQHLYPSFPYSSYTHMSDTDMVDLFGYLKTLPSVSRANEPHQLPLPFRLRRGIGLWKNLFFNDRYQVDVDPENKQLVTGRYIVEALSHCGECHTPRNLAGGLKSAHWLGGGPSPEGKGGIPNITPSKSGLGDWSVEDIVYGLETGFTPDYDSFGGSMVSVQKNMTHLPKSDLEAIAAYLKAVPPVESGK